MSNVVTKMFDDISDLKLMNHFVDVKLWLLAGSITLLQRINFSGNEWFSKYIFSDLSFLKWMTIVMMIDLITGITKVWKNEGRSKVTSKGLRDTVSKCIQYGSFLIITHILTHFEIDGKIALPNMDWINSMAYKFLLIIEIKSVYENIVAINPKLDFMSSLIDKILLSIKQNRDNKIDKNGNK